MYNTEWKERVHREREDLLIKLEALDKFIGSDAYGTLSPRQQDLLIRQRFIMDLYQETLYYRLNED